MKQNGNFLIEIGCEELPAKSILSISNNLSKLLTEEFNKNNISYNSVQNFATPRRLAVLIEGLPQKLTGSIEIKKGPSIKAAFNEQGKPTQASLGFAKSCGVDVTELERIDDDKGSWLAFRKIIPSLALITVLPEMVRVVERLPLTKTMRWGIGSAEFLRPVRWVVALFNGEVINTSLFSLPAGRKTYGHRFHYPEPQEINSEKDYEELLQKMGVIANWDKRQEQIKKALIEEANKIGAKILIEQSLLDEVTGLVEMPVVMVGNFEKRFLELPKEVLIITLRQHQKCFPLEESEFHLLPKFMLVSQINSKNPTQVIRGNEYVVKARLTDAEFFYHSDLKTSLDQYQSVLKNILFHEKLGTLADKAERLQSLIENILNLTQNLSKNNNLYQLGNRVGQLAKFDLCTQMVGEFPELQGIMGYYYAIAKGETKEVALAILEQYQPISGQSQLPKSLLGITLALADRIDHLVGYFGIGLMPTGDKDPFALRRAALGCVRIIVENKISLPLRQLLELSYQSYSKKIPISECIEKILDYILERMRVWLIENGVASDSIEAVYALKLEDLTDINDRIIALQTFRYSESAIALTSINKRVRKILMKALLKTGQPINDKLLREEAEEKLLIAIIQKAIEIEPYLKRREYRKVLELFSTIRPETDAFFDKVMVMVDDEKIRNNRLNILWKLQQLFLKVADVSLLQFG